MRAMDIASSIDRKSLRSFLYVSVGFAGTVIAVQPAFAQTKIEQMIVTAQKRAQDIQSVPASISAFSGDALQERQINSVAGLLGSTPNVEFYFGSGSTPQVTMRGVGSQGIDGTADASIAFHIDGVYQPRLSGLLGIMNDLDSVEVLRGPQGTVYGRNANAGVINFITKKPTDVFEASGTIFGGSYNRYGARGYVSGPLILDKLELRVSGIVDRHSGFGDNILNGSHPDADYYSGSRVAIRLKPVEDVTVDVIGSYSKDHNTRDIYNFDTYSGFLYDAVVAGAGPGAGRYTAQPRTALSNFPPEQTHVSEYLTSIIQWDITPDVSLKSITGLQHATDRIDLDVDILPANAINQQLRASSSTFSQEFNLNAKLWDRIDTVVGLYYLRDHNKAGQEVPFVGGFPFFGAPPASIFAYLDTVAKSRAAFFDATLNVTDGLRLLGGIRRTYDSKETLSTFWYGPIGGGGTGNPAIACQTPTRVPDLNYHSTTGKAGLQYDFTPEVMGYVVWQNGFKTGGYNQASCGQSFEPEKITSWEGGVKSTLFNDTVSLNFSVFSYDYKNLQLSRTVGTNQVVDNSAKAKVKGAEIETVVNFTDRLKADLGLGFLDSKYIGYTGSLVPGGPAIDATGNTLSQAPKFSLNAGVEYTFRLGHLGELKARGEALHSSRLYYEPFNLAVAKQDAYTVFNAIFTLTPDDCPYQFQAYVRNLTDKAYKTGAYYSSLFNFSDGYWGDPRTFGFEATVKF